MLAQIVAIVIFVAMFLLIVTDKIERHIVTLGCALITLILVFGVCMHSMDAVSEAASLGINTDFAKTYTANSIGTQSVYTSMSKAMSCARGVDFDIKACNSISYKAVMDALDEVE